MSEFSHAQKFGKSKASKSPEYLIYRSLIRHTLDLDLHLNLFITVAKRNGDPKLN